jgi:hypothetical protein
MMTTPRFELATMLPHLQEQHAFKSIGSTRFDRSR